MRIASLLFALILSLPAVAAPPAAEAPPVYQVELVLFLRDLQPGGEFWPEEPGSPDPARAIAILPLPPGVAPRPPVTPLGPGDYQLAAEAEALRRKGLTPLLHVAWQQPVRERDNDDWIWLEAKPLSGLARIGLGRFLHIDTDLALQTGDGPDARVIRASDRRRMRSGELHYLDHPAFGVLVRIDPYRAPEPASE